MREVMITIITVTFNDLANLVKTIKTVFEQTYQNIEYIVADGGSTDGTVEFIKNNESRITRWVSEKDSGIYDAMNKGLSLSSGDFICFMNCGDVFVASDVVETVVKKICDGDIGSETIVYTDYTRKGIIYRPPDNLDFYLYVRPLCHQSMYIGKDVFNKNGIYDLSYSVLADYEHTMRSYRRGTPFIHCECVSCDYMDDGFSASFAAMKSRKRDADRIKKIYFSKLLRIYYFIRYNITLPAVRRILFSDKSPLWLRRVYRKIANSSV